MTANPGLLSGVFVATPDDVEALEIGALVPPAYPSVAAKTLTPIELSRLEEILTGVPFEELVVQAEGPIIASGGDEGPWIIQVRSELVSAPRDLAPDDVPTTASRWADTEEWRLAGYSASEPGDLVDILQEMRDLAERVQGPARMYLKMSV